MRQNIISIEGSRAAGKSTVVNKLRQQLKYTNSFNLTGNMYPDNEYKTYKMYSDWLDFLQKTADKGINFLFDRFLFTEIVLCRLGYKKYDFEKSYEEFKLRMFRKGGLCDDYNMYFILLTCDEEEIGNRLFGRDKVANNNYDPFTVENSMKTQSEYIKLYNEIKEFNTVKTLLINTTNKTVDEISKEIIDLINQSEV